MTISSLSTSAFGGLFEEKAFGQKCLCDVLDVLRGYAAGVEVVSPGSDSRYDFVDFYSGRLDVELVSLERRDLAMTIGTYGRTASILYRRFDAERSTVVPKLIPLSGSYSVCTPRPPGS